MATALSRFADILWVDPAISPVTPKRFRHGSTCWPPRRPVPVGASILRITPSAPPFHSRGVLRQLTALLVRRQIRSTLGRLGRTPYAVVVSHLDDLLGDWGPDVLNVFYGTDDYVGGADLMGTARTRLEKEERRQLRLADTVIPISSPLADRWRNLGFTGPLTLIPNGVNVEHYGVDGIASAEVDLPKPVAGFVGHLSARIDIGLLESVVNAGCSLLLVGPHNPQWEACRFQELVTHHRVKWVGPVPFDDLPRYLRSMDIGITPYADSAFNRASFPLKTLEYLAAGKPAVSTDLPAVRWLATDLIDVAGRDNFGQIVLTRAKQDNRFAAKDRIDFAASHSWIRRAETFAKALGIQGGEDQDCQRQHSLKRG